MRERVFVCGPPRGLTQNRQDVAAARWQLIQKEPTIMGASTGVS
jgi:hypothetical protein